MPVYDGEFRTQAGQPGPGGLLRTGPVLPLEIAIPSALSRFLSVQNQQIPAPISGFGLIDTGATRSCVDSQVISNLGVNPIGIVNLGTARGRSQHHLYPAKFNFPAINFEVEFGSVVGVDLRGQGAGNTRIIALIGRDVLSRCILIYHGTKGSFSLAL
jgi:predicted aspartyl protease